MNIICLYVYPNNGDARYRDYALEFIAGHNFYNAGVPHRNLVICNSPVTDDTRLIFSDLPDCQLVEHDNSGYDIGAYQKGAREFPCDLMVFFGASTYFRHANWLTRMRDSFQKFGRRHLYGAMSHCGGPVNAHIRTTAFWCAPELMNSYPHRVTEPHQRYPFEHGPENLTDWCLRRGGAPITVTHVGEYFLTQWYDIPGGYHNGAQEYLLVGDRMSRPPYYPTL